MVTVTLMAVFLGFIAHPSSHFCCLTFQEGNRVVPFALLGGWLQVFSTSLKESERVKQWL